MFIEIHFCCNVNFGNKSDPCLDCCVFENFLLFVAVDVVIGLSDGRAVYGLPLNTILLGKLEVARLLKIFPDSVEPEGSLPCDVSL
jgi:hypothetical protein